MDIQLSAYINAQFPSALCVMGTNALAYEAKLIAVNILAVFFETQVACFDV